MTDPRDFQMKVKCNRFDVQRSVTSSGAFISIGDDYKYVAEHLSRTETIRLALALLHSIEGLDAHND